MSHRSALLMPFFIWALPLVCVCQTRQTEHTLGSSPSANRPHATLSDINWLQGAWEGPAFGGISEEIWSDVAGGSMMGVYRSVERGVVKFYEIDAIVETNGSLEMHLKHFNPDLTGWEEKSNVRIFPLLKLTKEALYFDGMTYVKTGHDSMRVYPALGDAKRGIREIVFEYHRKTL